MLSAKSFKYFRKNDSNIKYFLLNTENLKWPSRPSNMRDKINVMLSFSIMSAYKEFTTSTGTNSTPKTFSCLIAVKVDIYTN